MDVHFKFGQDVDVNWIFGPKMDVHRTFCAIWDWRSSNMDDFLDPPTFWQTMLNEWPMLVAKSDL